MSEFFELVPGGFQLNGYPTAERAIKLTGKRATRFAHLALHLHDLKFAGECLLELRSETQFPDIAREALWRSAVVHYLKCFGQSAARFSLDPKTIYEPGLPQQVHQYFKDLRNKHLVHDENPYLQALPTGIIGHLGDVPKVQDLLVLTFSGDGALHLTGVVLVIALPGAGRAGAVDAGRVPGRSGRPWRRLAWLVSFDQLLVADRVVTDGELEYSQEDQSAAA